MLWDIFCHHAYKLDEYSYDTRPISVAGPIMVLVLDDQKLVNGHTRYFLRSLTKQPPKYTTRVGCYMSLREIVPVQFYPKPLSIGRLLGITFSSKKRLDPLLFELITCKRPHIPESEWP